MVVGWVGVGGVGWVCGVSWGWSWRWALVVWQGGLSVHDAEWGSSILLSVVPASHVGRACEGKQGQCHLGLSVCCGIGAARGSLGAAGRLGLCGLGHIDSIHSRVAFGGGFG